MPGPPVTAKETKHTCPLLAKSDVCNGVTASHLLQAMVSDPNGQTAARGTQENGAGQSELVQALSLLQASTGLDPCMCTVGTEKRVRWLGYSNRHSRQMAVGVFRGPPPPTSRAAGGQQ